MPIGKVSNWGLPFEKREIYLRAIPTFTYIDDVFLVIFKSLKSLTFTSLIFLLSPNFRGCQEVGEGTEGGAGGGMWVWSFGFFRSVLERVESTAGDRYDKKPDVGQLVEQSHGSNF